MPLTPAEFDLAFNSLKSEIENNEHPEDDCPRCALIKVLHKSEGIESLCVNLVEKILFDDKMEGPQELMNAIFDTLLCGIYVTNQALESKQLEGIALD